jgi:hypothetical protein
MATVCQFSVISVTRRILSVPLTGIEARDATGTPVEVNEMTADSSAYIFRYEFGT